MKSSILKYMHVHVYMYNVHVLKMYIDDQMRQQTNVYKGIKINEIR